MTKAHPPSDENAQIQSTAPFKKNERIQQGTNIDALHRKENAIDVKVPLGVGTG